MVVLDIVRSFLPLPAAKEILDFGRLPQREGSSALTVQRYD
jgi:hypothetical protein